MSETATLDRRGPLADRRAASVTPLPPLPRFSLRGEAAALALLAEAFGVAPGEDACRAVVGDDRAVLWLGPDEWMLTTMSASTVPSFESLEQALGTVPHALVDVSHRNTGFLVQGAAAEALLAEGCPLDLQPATCPVGFCSRTVLGKCEVVLWRTAPDAFRIECWRSFAPYVEGFLAQAAENI